MKYLLLIILLLTGFIHAKSINETMNIRSNNISNENFQLAADTSTKKIAPSQIKRSTDFNKYKVIIKPTLQVLERSKEFEKWGSELAITSPQIVTFRFGNTAGDFSIAQWQVSNKENFSSLISTGLIKPIPEQGKVTHFNINFADIVSKSPQNPGLKPTNYYVRVATYKTLRQHNHITDSINIVLRKPSKNITKFTQIDPVLPPAKLKIEFKSFTCIEESDDGPGSDEPYLVVLKADPNWKDYRHYATRVFDDVDDGEKRDQNVVVYDYSRYKKDPKYGYSEPYWSKSDPRELIFLVGMGECDNWTWTLDAGDVWNKKCCYENQDIHMGNFGLWYAQSAGFSIEQKGPFDSRASTVKFAAAQFNWWLNRYNTNSLGVNELTFTKEEIDYARKNPGKPVVKNLNFWGDDSHYVATFHLTGIPEASE